MKKILAVILLIIVLIGALLSGQTKPDNIQPITPDEETICYYGCPNSKKVKKLNLSKKRGVK